MEIKNLSNSEIFQKFIEQFEKDHQSEGVGVITFQKLSKGYEGELETVSLKIIDVTKMTSEKFKRLREAQRIVPVVVSLLENDIRSAKILANPEMVERLKDKKVQFLKDQNSAVEASVETLTTEEYEELAKVTDAFADYLDEIEKSRSNKDELSDTGRAKTSNRAHNLQQPKKTAEEIQLYQRFLRTSSVPDEIKQRLLNRWAKAIEENAKLSKEKDKRLAEEKRLFIEDIIEEREIKAEGIKSGQVEGKREHFERERNDNELARKSKKQKGI